MRQLERGAPTGFPHPGDGRVDQVIRPWSWATRAGRTRRTGPHRPASALRRRRRRSGRVAGRPAWARAAAAGGCRVIAGDDEATKRGGPVRIALVHSGLGPATVQDGGPVVGDRVTAARSPDRISSPTRPTTAYGRGPARPTRPALHRCPGAVEVRCRRAASPGHIRRWANHELAGGCAPDRRLAARRSSGGGRPSRPTRPATGPRRPGPPCAGRPGPVRTVPRRPGSASPHSGQEGDPGRRRLVRPGLGEQGGWRGPGRRRAD